MNTSDKFFHICVLSAAAVLTIGAILNDSYKTINISTNSLLMIILALMFINMSTKHSNESTE